MYYPLAPPPVNNARLMPVRSWAATLVIILAVAPLSLLHSIYGSMLHFHGNIAVDDGRNLQRSNKIIHENDDDSNLFPFLRLLEYANRNIHNQWYFSEETVQEDQKTLLSSLDDGPFLKSIMIQSNIYNSCDGGAKWNNMMVQNAIAIGVWCLCLFMGVFWPFLHLIRLSTNNSRRLQFRSTAISVPDAEVHMVALQQRKKERKRFLRAHVESYSKILVGSDLCQEKETSSIQRGVDSCSMVYVPFSGQKNKEMSCTNIKSQSRMVPSLCAICLCKYNISDTVVWSANTSCKHVFHGACITSWLKKGNDHCPCCRQDFLR